MTIRLWELGFDEHTGSEATRGVTNWFQRWSTRACRSLNLPANGTPTYVAVLETDGPGIHAHLLFHIRPENRARFEAALHRRLRFQCGVPELPERSLDVRDAHNPEGLKLYLCKNMDPRFARAWGIRTTPGGRIHGRRSWSSMSLGPKRWKAQKAAYRRQASATNARR